MRDKRFIWIIVFVLALTSVNALVVNAPVNGTNLSRSTLVNWTSYAPNFNYSSNGSELASSGGTTADLNTFAYTIRRNMTISGIGFKAEDSVTNRSVNVWKNGISIFTINVTTTIGSNYNITFPYALNFSKGDELYISVSATNLFNCINNPTFSNNEFFGLGLTTDNALRLIEGNIIYFNSTAIVTSYDIYTLNSSGSLAFARSYPIPFNTSQNSSYALNVSLYDLNLSLGLYRFQVNASTNEAPNSNSNNSGYFNLTANSLLNINVLSQIDSSPLLFTSNLSGNIKSGTGSTSYDVINGVLYNLSINASNFNTANSTISISSFGSNTITRYLSAYNSINITIMDEATSNIITSSPNVSLTLVSGGGVVTSTTINGVGVVRGLSTDYYTLTFRKANYSDRQYYVNVPDGSFSNLNVYLNNGTTIAFNFKTNSGASLAGVIFQVYTFVNGSSTLVESSISDITGTIQVSLEPNKFYSFIASRSGYVNNSFSLTQVLFNSYDVIMTTSNQNIVVPSVDVFTSPVGFFKGQNVNFNIRFVSQYSSLTSYSYVVTYPSSVVSGSGSNDHGESFNHIFNLNNASVNSVVTVFYEYDLDNGVYYNRTLSYPITYILSNRTWVNIGNSINVTTGQDEVTGYYVGERVLIVVFISIILFGVGWSIGGAMTGLIFALIPILFFIQSGFVPKQLWYVTLFFMVVYFISRGSDT